MNATRFLPSLLALLALPLALVQGPAAQAFPIPPAISVVELYNGTLGHYFLTADPEELADIEAGRAGPGWVRTGYSFLARPAFNDSGNFDREVFRFYGTPGLGPNSHFYTADPVEAEILKRPGSGWTFEKVAFRIPVPDPATGQCDAQSEPVYRLYNNRWMFNDSNHRFAAKAAARDRMAARGWIFEGIAFCTLRAEDVALRTFAITVSPTQPMIAWSSVCENQSPQVGLVNIGPCIAINNHPPPRVPGSTQSNEFQARTGIAAPLVVVMGEPSTQGHADRTFVQVAGGGSVLGLHHSTLDRGTAIKYSSLNPLYQFFTRAGPTPATDTRFFPFRADYDTETDLVLSFTLNVKLVRVADANSHAYGHPTIEFIDTSTGRFLYFTIGTYGTVPPSDAVMRDDITGKVIVSSIFRPDTLYGRASGTSFLPTPNGFVSTTNPWGLGGPFELRLSADDFRRVLAAARTLEPGFSTDPAHYFVRNFHFNNEVVGDGEIGVNLSNYEMRLERR